MVFLPRKERKGSRVSLFVSVRLSPIYIGPSSPDLRLSTTKSVSLCAPPSTILSLLHPPFPSRRGTRRVPTSKDFSQRNLAATKLDFDLTYPLHSSLALCIRLAPFVVSLAFILLFFLLPFVPVIAAFVQFLILYAFILFLFFFAAFIEFLISYTLSFTFILSPFFRVFLSLRSCCSPSTLFFFTAFAKFPTLYLSHPFYPFLSLSFSFPSLQLLFLHSFSRRFTYFSFQLPLFSLHSSPLRFTFHPFPRRFPSSLPSPNFSSPTLYFSLPFHPLSPIVFLSLRSGVHCSPSLFPSPNLSSPTQQPAIFLSRADSSLQPVPVARFICEFYSLRG